MTNEEKLRVFEYYLNKMETESIRRFTKFALVRVPEYFWTLLASTSGRNHGPKETVIDHTLACLAIAESVCEQLITTGNKKEKMNYFQALFFTTHIDVVILEKN